MQDRAVKWAVRVVLEVGRRSGGLLPDDSGTDEAALAAQGVEAAHGVGVSNLGGLTEELVQVLVGVGVAATGHLEGDGMDLYAVPGLVVVDLGLHGLGEEVGEVVSRRRVAQVDLDPPDVLLDPVIRQSNVLVAGSDGVDGVVRRSIYDYFFESTRNC